MIQVNLRNAVVILLVVIVGGLVADMIKTHLNIRVPVLGSRV